ncbi:hypothetical protein [Paraburkholderia sp. SIMBA_054]|uniref:hypothetical protein n=1 Tax=Paraburkholderia sp. SIMBA_054 TaxID=3085795 RepID=UPI00397D7C6F
MKQLLIFGACIACAVSVAHAADHSDAGFRSPDSWEETAKVTGGHDGQFVSAPECKAGGVPVADVVPETPSRASVSVDMTYALQQENSGWRLSIVRADTLKRTPESSERTATVTTYCAL